MHIVVHIEGRKQPKSIDPAEPNMRISPVTNTTHLVIDPQSPSTIPEGRIDEARVDATTEAEIAKQQREDEEEALQYTARYTRRVRRRLGFSQAEFARRINVPQQTISDWEQGKRGPTGAARALLRILDKAPETALRVLT